MPKSDYVPPDKYDPYAFNTYNLSDGYIFKILNLNIPTSDSHQCRNALERFQKRDPNGWGVIIDGSEAWFEITALYDTTNHTDSYRQVLFHKLVPVKFFDKNPNNATISFFFNKVISALRYYEYSGQTPEALDERTFLKLHNYLINPVSDVKEGEIKGSDSQCNK